MNDITDNDLDGAKHDTKRAKRRSRRSFPLESLAAMSSVLAALAAASTLPAITTLIGKSNPFFDQPLGQTVASQAKSEAEMGKLRLEIAQVRSDLTHLNVTLSDGGTEAPTAVAINNIAGRLANVEKKQTALDRIILDDPQKALELPLLKRDVDAVKQSNDQAIASIKQNVDQVYDLNKWLLGSMAVGVLCLALSHFFRRKAD